MCNTWGGQQIYFPRGIQDELSSRDQLIYAEFNGYNQADLAMKHKMSIQWLYKIVDRVRSADIASRQSSINFDDEDDDDQ